MSRNKTILLLGNSVRYLAQSGHANGHRVTTVDAFGDDDTRAASDWSKRAAACQPGALAAAVPPVDAGGATQLVYSAGFECQPALLRQLRRRGYRLQGNDPGVLALQNDSRRWFGLLDQLDVAVPHTTLQRPVNPRGWLFKRCGSAGGEGVYRLQHREADRGAGYFQAYVKGPLCSLLFAANGRDVGLIGFNRLLARYPAAGDFRFAGVISGAQPTAELQAQMLSVAQRLTRALQLRGVNGLDFVLSDGKALMLELNARPPASLELYESALPGGGLACHLDACEGQLPETPNAPGARGLRVVTARRSLRMGVADWPDYVRDRPAPGVFVPVDAPVVSVHAAGAAVDSVEARLRGNADGVHELLARFVVEAA